MKIDNIGKKITLRPTDRKMNKGKAILEQTSILPKELPIEKKIYIESRFQTLERIKDKIQIAIDNIKGR